MLIFSKSTKDGINKYVYYVEKKQNNKNPLKTNKAASRYEIKIQSGSEGFLNYRYVKITTREQTAYVNHVITVNNVMMYLI